MAQPVLATCGLNEATIPPLTLIKQDSGVDGSFLIAAILGHRLKTSKDHRVLLIATQHNYTHYSSACLKLTYNLGPSRDSGQLQTLDIGAELFQNFPEAGPNLCDLQKRIEEFLQSSPQATILIDDLTFFLNLGHTESQLMDFVEAIVTGLNRLNQAVVIKLNTADLYDVLGANLDDLAATELRLERLTSGNFREVDGRLTVSRVHEHEDALVQTKQRDRQVLFKVNERNVKVFVPGELGIKNL
ncbi:elongator complex protein 6 [Culex pipiens pallens]|uniref:elongator complex protein 6 n=1 Tax=Culex pipiens pallens TaxID=42434 RepID=UPI0019533FF1|nr:elongator complex protein 6 [Culex pipiens pallens]XP_039444737.1 elongator complex protein 6 [Culex pipiens pallens]XP_039444738.1 elongator complex protein 6 [Culex pipiens pallens]